MKITKHDRQEAKGLLRTCTHEGLLDDVRVQQLVAKIIEMKPRRYLPVLMHFQRLVKLEEARRTATVESAVPMDDAARAQVKLNLSRRYGGELHVSFRDNPALIGGVRIRVGSDVYDGSVRTRLLEIEKRLSEG